MCREVPAAHSRSDEACPKIYLEGTKRGGKGRQREAKGWEDAQGGRESHDKSQSVIFASVQARVHDSASQE